MKLLHNRPAHAMDARARMLECHHALIMFVVLCGRCRRRGADLGDALLRRLIPCCRLIPRPYHPARIRAWDRMLARARIVC